MAYVVRMGNPEDPALMDLDFQANQGKREKRDRWDQLGSQDEMDPKVLYNKNSKLFCRIII